MNKDRTESGTGGKPDRTKPPPRTIDSAELLKGNREVVIQHGNETYRLRVTRQGKLILHK